MNNAERIEPGIYGETEPLEQKLIKALSSVGSGYAVPGMVDSLVSALGASPKILASETGSVRNPFGMIKGYADEKYPTSLPVKAYTEPGVPYYDEVKGLNSGHAFYRAKANWPGTEVQRTGLSGQAADKAQKIMDSVSKLYQEYRQLKP